MWRHATGSTEKITTRSYCAGPRRWWAPWTRHTAVSFGVGGCSPRDAELRFATFAADLRDDALRPGFRGGFVEWVTVRDYWTGAPNEDLRWIWRTCTPVEVRRLTIAEDLTEVDTGAIAREAR